jgi:hypothetical protein
MRLLSIGAILFLVIPLLANICMQLCDFRRGAMQCSDVFVPLANSSSEQRGVQNKCLG